PISSFREAADLVREPHEQHPGRRFLDRDRERAARKFAARIRADLQQLVRYEYDFVARRPWTSANLARQDPRPDFDHVGGIDRIVHDLRSFDRVSQARPQLRSRQPLAGKISRIVDANEMFVMQRSTHGGRTTMPL